jgi:hypothetical protein
MPETQEVSSVDKEACEEMRREEREILEVGYLHIFMDRLHVLNTGSLYSRTFS